MFERYRLRLAVRRDKRRVELVRLPGDDRIFPSWREAQTAAEIIRGKKNRPVVVQSVLVDEAGNVTWPMESAPVVTGGAWRGTAQVQYAARAKPPKGGPVRKKRKPPAAAKPTEPERVRAVVDKNKLNRRTRKRIAEIRKKDPFFGRRAEPCPSLSDGLPEFSEDR